MKSPFRNVGLRMRITLALATASAGTALLVLIGVLWIIHGIVDRADERDCAAITMRCNRAWCRSCAARVR